MFKLKEEQIQEILNEYGSSKLFIGIVENILNELDVILDEKEYFEVVAACASRKETNNLKTSSCLTKQEVNRVFMPADEIVEVELDRKYDNFEDANPIIQSKIFEYKRRK